MFSLGGSEILVLAFIALILFGNKNLPENMKKLVKGLNEVKKVAHDAQRSWIEVRDDVTRQIMADEAEEEIKKELAEVKKLIESNQASLPKETTEQAEILQVQPEVQPVLEATVERENPPEKPLSPS